MKGKRIAKSRGKILHNHGVSGSSRNQKTKRNFEYLQPALIVIAIIVIIALVVLIAYPWNSNTDAFDSNNFNSNSSQSQNQSNTTQNNNPLTGLIPINGECGLAAKAYGMYETFPSGDYCKSGYSSPSRPPIPMITSNSTWICVGSNGGTSVNCMASRPSTTDTTPPVTTIISGCGGEFNTGSQTVEFLCSDIGGSGCSEIQIKVDSGSWRKFSVAKTNNKASIIVSKDGNHTISYWARDNSNNIETPTNILHCSIINS